VISIQDARNYPAASQAFNAAEQRANAARALFERDLAQLGVLASR
jgi:hypothetical protein